jgi:hypothetical protein
MNVIKQQGGCLCGEIRYAIDGAALQVVNCHCVNCRRHSGAPFLTYAAFPSRSVNYLLKTPKYYRSSAEAVRGHCANCGSPIDFTFDADPTLIWLSIGSLDHPEQMPATENWFVKNRLPWIHADNNIPTFLEFPLPLI